MENVQGKDRRAGWPIDSRKRMKEGEADAAKLSRAR